MDNNSYIEFNINGILKVPEKNKKAALKKLNSLLSKIVEDNIELVRSDYSIDVVSEAEIAYAMSNYDPNHFD